MPADLTKREKVLLRALERALFCAGGDPTPLRAARRCRDQASRTYRLFSCDDDED